MIGCHAGVLSPLPWQSFNTASASPTNTIELNRQRSRSPTMPCGAVDLPVSATWLGRLKSSLPRTPSLSPASLTPSHAATGAYPNRCEVCPAFHLPLLHAPGFATVFLGPWLLLCWRIWCLHVWLRWPVNATSSRSNNAPHEGGWPQPIATESAKLRVRWAGRTSFVLVCRLLWPKKPQEGFHTTWILLWTGRAARTGGTARALRCPQLHRFDDAPYQPERSFGCRTRCVAPAKFIRFDFPPALALPASWRLSLDEVRTSMPPNWSPLTPEEDLPSSSNRCCLSPA